MAYHSDQSALDVIRYTQQKLEHLAEAGRLSSEGLEIVRSLNREINLARASFAVLLKQEEI